MLVEIEDSNNLSLITQVWPRGINHCRFSSVPCSGEVKGIVGLKSKYVIVRVASAITGSTGVWNREGAVEKFTGILLWFEAVFSRKASKLKGRATFRSGSSRSLS